MYHVQLRQGLHNMSRFNLDEGELREILDPWVAGQPVRFGERIWSPQQASVTVLAGPELALGELSLGRGWRTAERRGEDVTERSLAGARRELVDRAAAPSEQNDDALAAGVTLAGLLGGDAAALLAAWREVAAQAPGSAPSETLALAERRLAERGSQG